MGAAIFVFGFMTAVCLMAGIAETIMNLPERIREWRKFRIWKSEHKIF